MSLNKCIFIYLPITNALTPVKLCKNLKYTGRNLPRNSYDHNANIPFIKPINTNIPETRPNVNNKRKVIL